MKEWRSSSNLIMGMEGAPGHQKVRGSAVGNYRGEIKTVERWDPVAADIGGVWDQLLQQGEDVWLAIANSDFHREKWDYWPGEFSETWLYAPDKTESGVFKALRAGTFFAGHGHIVREAMLSVTVEGLPRPAYPGEVLEIPVFSMVSIKLDGDVPQKDWEGELNRIDEIELIAITDGVMKVIKKSAPKSHGPLLEDQILAPEGGLVLRARGRRYVDDGPDLMFYTNPIRILTHGEAAGI